MRFLMNTNGQQSDARSLLDQERRISDAQIKDQTVTDLTLKRFCETRQRFDASRRSVVESVAAWKSQHQKLRFLRIGIDLFCSAQRCTEITKFVVDLGWSFNGLSNFFAEQRSIAFP